MDEISRPGGRADHYSRIRFYPHKIETLYQTLRVLIKFQILFRIKFSPRIIMHILSVPP